MHQLSRTVITDFPVSMTRCWALAVAAHARLTTQTALTVHSFRDLSAKAFGNRWTPAKSQSPLFLTIQLGSFHGSLRWTRSL
jgi:hypothetical protein